MPQATHKGIFTLQLISATGSVLISTATAHNVSLDFNTRNITCSDSVVITADTSEQVKTVRLSKHSQQNKLLLICIILISIHFTAPPPSPPLNLTFTSTPTLSSITISWVAPLDTPLFVHSYTVTVRNSCNSSQVMVYNSTDNRSSLSITELIADGEYSVTVVGRDGSGRLGEESEELRMSLRGEKH